MTDDNQTPERKPDFNRYRTGAFAFTALKDPSSNLIARDATLHYHLSHARDDAGGKDYAELVNAYFGQDVEREKKFFKGYAIAHQRELERSNVALLQDFFGISKDAAVFKDIGDKKYSEIISAVQDAEYVLQNRKLDPQSEEAKRATETLNKYNFVFNNVQRLDTLRSKKDVEAKVIDLAEKRTLDTIAQQGKDPTPVQELLAFQQAA